MRSKAWTILASDRKYFVEDKTARFPNCQGHWKNLTVDWQMANLLDEPTAISLVADTCLACILALWPAGAFWFIHIHEMYYSHAKPIYKSFAFRLCCALMWTNLFCTPLMEHSSWVPVADLIIRVRLDLGQNIEFTLYIKHSKIVSAEALKRPVLLCCQVFYGFENWIHYRWTNQAP